ncbi:MAG: D-glycero-beta-D-manno-heptose 1,7-bisphosphate 7-phosphatase [Pseudomonadota bacterium]|nr:D-glycero-beta-D-manno-heptose 1,7-bisphosphate 7-phosphatase [Pseudomonadota bacterium]
MYIQPLRIIVLDRDGVINQDSKNFIREPIQWKPLPGSLDAIARLYNAGFLIVVATNQSGVGRGLFSLDTLWDIHKKMLREVARSGGHIEKIFFCIHAPENNCDCRKPAPGMLYQISAAFNCQFDQMTVIGDSARDIYAARAVGSREILVRTGNGIDAEVELANEDGPLIFADLAAAADALINEHNIK